MTQNKSRCTPGAREYLYVLPLLAIVTIAWCAAYNRWTPSAWATPVCYSGDALAGLLGTKAMMKGEILPFLPKFPSSLGAPFVANWNDWPSTEEAVVAWSALLGRIFGLFSGANLTLLFGHLLAAGAFYYVCRYLRYHPLFSLAGAALFSLTRYSFARSFSHLTLTYYWHIPLGLLVLAWCVAARPATHTRRKTILCLIVAVIFGTHSPYYSWLFCQFLMLAAAICFLRGQRKRALFPIFVAATVFATFLLANFDTLYGKLTMGPNPGAIASRSFADLERYALKPIDLILPLGHRIPVIEAWSIRSYFGQALFLGEKGAPYAGIAGIAALVILLVRTASAIATRAMLKVPWHFWSILWIFVYSVVGGVGALFGAAGLILFRCSNRYSIVVVALLLIFLVKEMGKLARRWSYAGKLALSAGVLTIGLFDQMPRFFSAQDVAIPRWQATTDRTLVAAMESQLPNRALVFQLPVIDFPEAPPLEQMDFYEQLRPILHSRTLRFSHGSHKGRYRERWQREAEQLGAEGLVKTLERYGFAAVLISKAGYKDSASSLLTSLKGAGRGTIIAESYQFICIRLAPVTDPLLPPEFDGAWYGLEGDMRNNVRWSSGDAKIKFHHAGPNPVVIDLEFSLATRKARTLEIWQGTQKLYSGFLKPGESPIAVDLKVTLPPQGSELNFRTNLPGEEAAEGDPRKVAYSLHNFRVASYQR